MLSQKTPATLTVCVGELAKSDFNSLSYIRMTFYSFAFQKFRFQIFRVGFTTR